MDGRLLNTAALVCDGRLLGFVAKQHLAGDGIHYEPRWFQTWRRGEVGLVNVQDRRYPVGGINLFPFRFLATASATAQNTSRQPQMSDLNISFK